MPLGSFYNTGGDQILILFGLCIFSFMHDTKIKMNQSTNQKPEFTCSTRAITTHTAGFSMLQHFHVWPAGAGDRTTNLLIGGRPPEPQLLAVSFFRLLSPLMSVKLNISKLLTHVWLNQHCTFREKMQYLKMSISYSV